MNQACQPIEHVGMKFFFTLVSFCAFDKFNQSNIPFAMHFISIKNFIGPQFLERSRNIYFSTVACFRWFYPLISISDWFRYAFKLRHLESLARLANIVLEPTCTEGLQLDNSFMVRNHHHRQGSFDWMWYFSFWTKIVKTKCQSFRMHLDF